MEKTLSVIQKIRIEVSCDNHKIATPIHSLLSSLMNESGFAIIDELTTKHISDNQLLKDDTLHLDLGNFTLDNLNKEFIPTLKDKFAALLLNHQTYTVKAINDSDSVRNSYTKSNEDLKLLDYFLKKGYFPWWYKATSSFKLHDFVQNVLRQESYILKQFFFNVGIYSNVRERMAFKFSDRNLATTVEIIEPGEANFIVQFREKTLFSLINDNRNGINVNTDYGKHLWLFILNYLLVERGSLFNRKSYLKNQLTQLAVKFSYDLKIFGSLLSEVLAATQKLSFIPSQMQLLLSSIIDEIENELPPKYTSFDAIIKNISQPVTQNIIISILKYFNEFGELPPTYFNFSRREFNELINRFIEWSPQNAANLISLNVLKYKGFLGELVFTNDTLTEAIIRHFQVNEKTRLFINAIRYVLVNARKDETYILYNKFTSIFLNNILTKKENKTHDFLWEELIDEAPNHEIEFLLENIPSNSGLFIGKSKDALALMLKRKATYISIKGDKQNSNTEDKDAIEYKGNVLSYILYLLGHGSKPWWGRRFGLLSNKQLLQAVLNLTALQQSEILSFASRYYGRRRRFFSIFGETGFKQIFLAAKGNAKQKSFFDIIDYTVIPEEYLIDAIWSYCDIINNAFFDEQYFGKLILLAWVTADRNRQVNTDAYIPFQKKPFINTILHPLFEQEYIMIDIFENYHNMLANNKNNSKGKIIFDDKAKPVISALQTYAIQRDEQNLIAFSYNIIQSFLQTGGIFTGRVTTTDEDKLRLAGALMVLENEDSNKLSSMFEQDEVQLSRLLKLLEYVKAIVPNFRFAVLEQTLGTFLQVQTEEQNDLQLKSYNNVEKGSEEESFTFAAFSVHTVLVLLENFLLRNKKPLEIAFITQKEQEAYWNAVFIRLYVNEVGALQELFLNNSIIIDNAKWLLKCWNSIKNKGSKEEFILQAFTQMIKGKTGEFLQDDNEESDKNSEEEFKQNTQLQRALFNQNKDSILNYILEFYPEMITLFKVVFSFFENILFVAVDSSSPNNAWRVFYFRQLAKIIKQNEYWRNNSALDIVVEIIKYIFQKEANENVGFYRNILKKLMELEESTKNPEKILLHETQKLIVLQITKIKNNELAVTTRKKEKNKSVKEKKNKTENLLPLTEDDGTNIYVNNAGIVLLAPFLKEYLYRMDVLTEDKNDFIDEYSQEKATQLLQFLVDGEDKHPEFDLTLLKVLCGISIVKPISLDAAGMKENDIAIGEELLQTVLSRWEKMNTTSIGVFRGTFLLREGKLEEKENEFILHVEKKGVDVLLQFIPWTFQLIKLPWMTKHLIVQWI